MSKNINDRIDSIIEKMTLEQKASLCSGKSFWETESFEELNIPSLLMSDGPHGLRYVADRHHQDPARPATCFPTASAMAASWDRSLLEDIGQAIAEECKANDVDIILGPGINIKRSPLGGRNFEYYSEDPYLTAELAISFINAVQSKGVGTSLKHYVANNQETKRFFIDADIEERALKEIYLYAFERCVKEAEPWTVMCAYNRINGVFASENNYLLTELLRNRWNFSGFVVSDWGAVHDRVEGIKAGLDLEMPGPSDINDKKIIEAVNSGELREKLLDQVVRRNLKIILRAQSKNSNRSEIPGERHAKLAEEKAAECFVLLKNENDLLPLGRSEEYSSKQIAVIGKLAENPRYQGGGSSKVNPTDLKIPLKELRKKSDHIGFDLIYYSDYSSQKAISKAQNADVTIIFAGHYEGSEVEGEDRKSIDLPEQQIKAIKDIAKVQNKTIVILNSGSAISLGEWTKDASTILQCWLAGQSWASALIDVLWGKVNPSGSLPETFPQRIQDNPSYLEFPGKNDRVNYREGIFTGYRYYDKKEIEPGYPFGHGKSFTEFEYMDLKCPDVIRDFEKPIELKVRVRNTGPYSGKETVQIYISQKSPLIERPVKELKGFKKLEIKSGEIREFKLELIRDDFAYFLPQKNRWVVENDKYIIQAGRSSCDIRLRSEIKIKCGDVIKYLTPEHSVDEWLKNTRGKNTLKSKLNSEQLKFARRNSKFPLYRLSHLGKGEITDDEINEIMKRYLNKSKKLNE